MNRFYEIVLLLVVAQASIGFVNGLGIFTDTAYTQPDNPAAHWYINDSDNYFTDNTVGVSDYVQMITGFIGVAITMLWDILGAVVFIYPALVTTFMMPAALALVLQSGIYFIYATFLIQMFWKPFPSEG